jgi:hypothetical protein
MFEDKYRVYFVNFNYYSTKVGDTLEEAKEIAKSAGFQSVISYNNTNVLCWCPIGGFRKFL